MNRSFGALEGFRGAGLLVIKALAEPGDMSRWLAIIIHQANPPLPSRKSGFLPRPVVSAIEQYRGLENIHHAIATTMNARSRATKR